MSQNENSAAIMHNDGHIRYPMQIKLKSYCQIDMTYFPFDNQICYIKY
jgi:nicotinic acetylcholine receptor